jgi:hypothetical protein
MKWLTLSLGVAVVTLTPVSALADGTTLYVPNDHQPWRSRVYANSEFEDCTFARAIAVRS